MLVALKVYHRRCKQHLKRYIANEKKKTVQTLRRSVAEDILEKAWAEYIKKKQKLEEKQQRELDSLQILPSRQRLMHKNKQKEKRQKKNDCQYK